LDIALSPAVAAGPIAILAAPFIKAAIQKRLPLATGFAFFAKGTLAGGSVVGASVQAMIGPTLLSRLR
jgi:hypothetical protein